MYHCYRHEIDHSSSDCPRCLAEQRHEELVDLTREGQDEAARLASEQHEEHLRAIEESDYRRANPGDYQCPHCGYITLRLDFDRCPFCRGSVQEKDPEYWTRVHVELERRAKAAAEAAAERQKQKAVAEAKQRAEAQARAEAAAAQAAFDAKANFSLVLVLIVAAIGLAIWISQRQTVRPTGSVVTSRTVNTDASKPPAARSEDLARLPPAAAPERIPEPYRAVLGAWLQQDRRFRSADLSDCGCESDVLAMRAAWDNDDPQFVVADLNGDSREDFAVVLLDRTKDPSRGIQGNTADFDQLWNMAVAVFRGPVSVGMPPSALFTKIGSGGGALLFYRRDDRTLLVGKWEGHGTPILADGSSFKLWEPPNDPIPRDITPPVGREFVGEWYSGGADCMKVFPRQLAGAFSVKVWYCNAGEPESGVNATLVDGRLTGDDGALLIEEREPPGDWPSWRGPRPKRVLVGTFKYPPPNDGHINREVMFASVPDRTLR